MAKGAKRAAVTTEPVEGPWELPQSWHWQRLGSLCTYVSRGRGPKYVAEGGVQVVNQRCIRWSGVDLAHSKRTDAAEASRLPSEQLLREGDILWNSTGTGTIGRAAIYRARGSDPVVADSHVTIVRLRDTDPRWVHHWISTHAIQQVVTGIGSTNQVELSRQTVLDLPIPCSEPAVQRQVLTRVEELFAEIDDGALALASAVAGCQTFRNALLAAAVTGELTGAWRSRACSPAVIPTEIVAEHRRRHAGRGRYKPPRMPKSGDLAALPATWCWATVEAAGDVLLGRQRAPQHHAGDHLRPYLRVANVLEDELDLTDVKMMNFTPAEFEVFELRDGDVLLNEGQAPELLGRPAIFRGEIEECCFQKTLLRFRAGQCVEPEFALIVFRHYMRSGRFRRESRITTNIGHLTQVRFLPMEFPVPPIEEQREIVSRVRRSEGAAIELATPAIALSELRQSILAAAFRGELT